MTVPHAIDGFQVMQEIGNLENVGVVQRGMTR
jgi:hypothetical protein